MAGLSKLATGTCCWFGTSMDCLPISEATTGSVLEEDPLLHTTLLKDAGSSKAILRGNEVEKSLGVRESNFFSRKLDEIQSDLCEKLNVIDRIYREGMLP